MKRTKIIITVVVVGLLLWVVADYWYEAKITLNIKGQVVDTTGTPIPLATVQASLGLDNEGAPSITSQNGNFEVKSAASRWYKGPPLFSVKKEGFCTHVGHFVPWKFGDRNAVVKVTLKRGVVNAVEYGNY